MKILYIHNCYSKKTPTGEERAARELVSLLIDHGHIVEWFTANSDDVRKKKFGALSAFFTGIYNPKSASKLSKVLDEYKPDIVQVQNIYPVLSSSIFKPLKDRNIPVIMRCPNYRLFCPNGLCLNNKGNVCERCWRGLHEINEIIGNCESNIFKSIGYAARNAFNRITGKILSGVDVFIVQSEFQRQKFISQGIPKERICIIPGIAPNIKPPKIDSIGSYVSFVGRVSVEKGIYEFIDAARSNPDIPFKVAGFYDASFKMPSNIPANLEFMGFLKGDNLNSLYAKSRIIVVPSKWYEGFPNVILQGFIFGLPVITTNIGAMQSIVETGKNGILVEPGNAKELGIAIRNLYFDKESCKKYGESGREKISTIYSRDHIYELLMNAYNTTMNMVNSNN